MTQGESVIDRRQYLLGPGMTLNGIDFVEIATADQTTLRVHFINSVPVAGTLAGSPLNAKTIAITGGEVITSVAVLPVDETTDWTVDNQDRPVLTVRVKAPGDFSTYQLRILSPALDPFFDSCLFSFKANCPSDFDCKPSAAPCSASETIDVPIDYLAKDFTSFVRALSDFSSQRYASWLERCEADLGMVVMEVLAAIADELSYFQDRIAGEALLGTATQPRSLLHLARLVDYEPAPATAARVLLQLDVDDGASTITALHCQAQGANGAAIDFELGDGLVDATTGKAARYSYPVDARWNRYNSGEVNLAPYWWDDSERCLTAGSTSFDIRGWGFGLTQGQSLLIDTDGPTSADPPVREVVVTGLVPQEVLDPLFGIQLTHVELSSPTTADHDLTRTKYAGNLVWATHGVSTTETFSIPGGNFFPDAVIALVRQGPNWTPDDPSPEYFYCLSDGPLAWFADADSPQTVRPEIVVAQIPADAAQDPEPWLWERRLLDAQPDDSVFTLSPEQYSPVLTAAVPDSSTRTTWFDYDGGDGTTLHFGNSTFGARPAPGADFHITYRVDGGVAGNVPADTVTRVLTPASSVLSCTNPFPAMGGTDAQTPQQIRDSAPQAFQVNPLRLVRPSDYIAAAQSLPWVQQAGTAFRWTGSWLTVLTTADPKTTEQPTLPDVEMLSDLLNQQRLAGYESYVLGPRYASVDLHITLCAASTYFAADVESAVLRALRPGPLPGGRTGFFDHTRWRFGAPLESSALLAAIQTCIGVSGVTRILFRQRGVQRDWTMLPDTLTVGADQILRVDDDPNRPEAGSLTVIVNGGKA